MTYEHRIYRVTGTDGRRGWHTPKQPESFDLASLTPVAWIDPSDATDVSTFLAVVIGPAVEHAAETGNTDRADLVADVAQRLIAWADTRGAGQEVPA